MPAKPLSEKASLSYAGWPNHDWPCLAVLGYVIGAAITGATVPAGMFDRNHARAYGRIVMATAVLLALAAALQEAEHGHGFGFLPVIGAVRCIKAPRHRRDPLTHLLISTQARPAPSARRTALRRPFRRVWSELLI